MTSYLGAQEYKVLGYAERFLKYWNMSKEIVNLVVRSSLK